MGLVENLSGSLYWWVEMGVPSLHKRVLPHSLIFFFSHFPPIFNLSLKPNIYFVVGSYNEFVIFMRSNTCIRNQITVKPQTRMRI